MTAQPTLHTAASPAPAAYHTAARSSDIAAPPPHPADGDRPNIVTNRR
ncbi:MAG: hypothetical protein ACFB4J_07035 [Elainellaceae cyanobacterium]